jgi:hypothetical protein
MLKRVLLAFVVGLFATGLLIGLSFVVDSFGFSTIANALFWQNTLLQSYAPLGNIGTAAHPVYEGSPLNFLAFLASIPLGFIVYGVLAYAALTWAHRRA